MPRITATYPTFGLSVNHDGQDGKYVSVFSFPAIPAGTIISAALSWRQGSSLAGGTCKIGPSDGYYTMTGYRAGGNSANLLAGDFSFAQGQTSLDVCWCYPYPGGTGWKKSTWTISELVLTIDIQQAEHTVTVSVRPDGAGNARAYPDRGIAGTVIGLSQRPAGGYQFDHWESSPSVSIASNQFTMPDVDVAITAVYTGSPVGPTFNASVSRATNVEGVQYKDAGRYVQNHSGVIAELKNVTPSAGRTVIATSIEIIGYEGGAYYATGTGDVRLTSGLLTGYGTHIVRFSAYDSDGYATYKDIQIDVKQYANPHLDMFSVWRTDDQGADDKNGVYAKFKFGFEVSGLNDWNTYTAKMIFNDRETELSDSSGEGFLKNADDTLMLFPIDKTFIVTIEVSDLLETKRWHGTIRSLGYLIHFSGNGDSVAFGHACPDELNRFTISDAMTFYIGGYTLAEYIQAVIDGDIR